MIYLIYGNQEAAVVNRLKSIVKDILPEKDDMNYVRFDATEILIQNIIDECNYVPLGYDHKVVVCDTAYFLLKPKPKQKIEVDQDYSILKKYIESPNPECDLIFTINSLNIDQSNELVKHILKNGKEIQIKELESKDWTQGVSTYCKDKQKLDIEYDAIQELAERTNGDIAMLQNCVSILKSFKEHITREDVCLMVARPLEDNSFQMYNYLMNENNIKAVSLLRDLKVMNVEPITLIAMLANQFRLLQQIRYLTRNGFDDFQISKELNIKPVRVTIFKKNGLSISEKTIMNTLEELYQLDLKIKSGQVDRYYIFELFLLNFKKR